MTTFYNEAREFAKKYIDPIAKEIDEQERFPEEVFKELGKAGYFKLMIPTELGGLGKDMQEHAEACVGVVFIFKHKKRTLASRGRLEQKCANVFFYNISNCFEYKKLRFNEYL